jgi:peptidase E
MRKILLTSSGFENQRIMALFRGLLDREPGETKALFIPTAAIDAGAIAVLPKCMNDLLNAGIPPENITSTYTATCPTKSCPSMTSSISPGATPAIFCRG